jgi:hypothetical protein
LTGGDPVTVNGSMVWGTSATLAGSGLFNVNGALTINPAAGTAAVVDGRTMNLGGATTWSGPGVIYFEDGGVINNLAGEIFTVSCDSLVADYSGAAGAFNNAGTLLKTAGTGTTTFGTAFNNSGTVQVNSGTLYLNNGFSNTPSSFFSFPISGSGSGTNYGQLVVAGNFPLAGTLSVNLTNGFVPSVGDSFRILNWGSKQGGFSAANGFNLGNGLYFQGIADKSGLTLVTKTTIVPTPPSPTNLVNQVVAYGDTAVFSFSPLGVAPFTYQWMFNGTYLVGQTNALLVINNVQAASLGDYCVFVMDALGVTNTYCAMLTAITASGITTQPNPQTVNSNTLITLTAVGNGGGTLRYQWRINGENIPSATNSTYVITNAQPENGGTYSVLVANPVRVISSSDAEVIILSPSLPFTNNFPGGVLTNGYGGVGSGNDTNVTSEVGDPDLDGKQGSHLVWVQWTAPASGVATFSTQGSSFDTLLGIYTGTSLTNLVGVAADDDRAGYFTSQAVFNTMTGTNYQIAVDGRASASGDIVLNWNLNTNITEIPIIVQQPLDMTVVAGGTANFDMFAASTANLSYQWYLGDWLAISGATTNTLTLTNVSYLNVGTYSVEVTAATGESVESLPASLEIGPSLSYDKFSDLMDAATGGGSSNLRIKPNYESPAFPSVSVGTIGSQIINNFNSTTEEGEPIHADVVGGSSRWYLLTALTNATMEIDTLSSDIATVLAIYTGTNIFTLQMITNNVNGAPDGVRSLVEFHATNGTSYLVAVDGVNGAQGNIYVNWRMGIPPNVAGPAQMLVIANGSGLTLQSGLNTNVTSPTYQWQVNGANIPGATNATYSLSSLQYNQVGSYGVVVSNLVGQVVNAIATVSAQTPLSLTAGKNGFQVSGSATQAVVLQLSTNLTVWNPLYTNQTPLRPVNFTDTNSPSRNNGFYRLKSWP